MSLSGLLSARLGADPASERCQAARGDQGPYECTPEDLGTDATTGHDELAAHPWAERRETP